MRCRQWPRLSAGGRGEAPLGYRWGGSRLAGRRLSPCPRHALLKFSAARSRAARTKNSHQRCVRAALPYGCREAPSRSSLQRRSASSSGPPFVSPPRPQLAAGVGRHTASVQAGKTSEQLSWQGPTAREPSTRSRQSGSPAVIKKRHNVMLRRKGWTEPSSTLEVFPTERILSVGQSYPWPLIEMLISNITNSWQGLAVSVEASTSTAAGEQLAERHVPQCKYKLSSQSGGVQAAVRRRMR